MAVAVEKQSRREILEARVAQHEADRAAALEKIEQLKAHEAELRVAGIRSNPGRRSDAGGALSDVSRTVQEREKLERSIVHLNNEIAAAVVVLDEFRASESAAIFAQARAEASELDEIEQTILGDMRAARDAFYASWAEMVALYEERRSFPYRWPLTEQAQINQLVHEARPKWDPPPTSAADAFDRLTRQAEQSEKPMVTVSLNADVEPPTLAQKADHYSLVNRLRNEGVTDQPLPVYPELHDPSFRGRAQTAAESLPPQEVGETQADEIAAEAGMTKTGRRLFRRAGES